MLIGLGASVAEAPSSGGCGLRLWQVLGEGSWPKSSPLWDTSGSPELLAGGVGGWEG